MKASVGYQFLEFGPSKQYIQEKVVELPLMVRRIDNRDDALIIQTYLVKSDIYFLCGKKTLECVWIQVKY